MTSAIAVPETKLIARVFPTAAKVARVGHTGRDGDYIVVQDDHMYTVDVRTCPTGFALQLVEETGKDSPGWAVSTEAMPHVLIVRGQQSYFGVFDAARLRICTRQHLAEWATRYPVFGVPHDYEGLTWTSRYCAVPLGVVIDTLTLEYGSAPTIAGLPVAQGLRY